jgi:hypothetical protein
VRGRRSPAAAAAPAPRAHGARRVVAALLAAAVALAACGAGATPVPSGPAALPAGTHTSRVFSPQVTFTVPDGWWNPSDSPSFFSILPVESDVVGIYLFRDPLPASQDPTCPQTAEPGVGTTSLALLAWIRDLPGLVVGNPRLVTVGGLRGTEIDIAIEAGWTASCPFANGVPTVPLFVGGDGQLRWVIAGSERLRLSLLDVPGGGTVVVDVDAFDGSAWDQLLAAATPIVNSFVFATP